MNSIIRGGAFSKQKNLKSFDELIREHASGLSYRALEQRMAFDGAAAATAATVAASDQSNDPGHAASNDGASTQDHSEPVNANDLAVAMAGEPPSPTGSTQSVVFIDSGVTNAAEHLAGIDPSAEVVFLNANSGGLEQISSYLAGRTDIGSIHIVSHGDEGSLILGDSIVTGHNLTAYASELASIGHALSADGDILIYGCDFGAGESGRAAANLLASLTGADVAVSTDATGSLASGGDFDLEYATGAIESKVAFSVDGQSTYDDLLSVTVNNGNGALVIGVANTLYTVDTTTGKATAITTIPGTIGGVAFGGTANSIAIDQTNGLIYYCDTTSANTNRALFAYDFINDTHILIDSDLTNNGAGASITVGTTGLGSGSATFYNGVLYLGVENVTGSNDQIYAITFTGAGRTVATAATFGAAITGTNDWGDLSIDVAGNALVSQSQATGITRYSLTTGAQLTNVAYAATGPQSAHDVNGNVYVVTTSLQQVNATTGANVGAAIAITTDGTTPIAAPPDAASWIPQTGSIGDKIFDDNNTDGVFNGGDTGIANVTVQLIDDVNNNGVVDVGERILATDTTDASGNYLFSGVLPGRYVIRVTDTNGVLGTAPSTTGGATQTATLNKIGASLLTEDFGYNNYAPIVDLNSTPVPSPSSGTTTSNLVTSGNFGTAASGTPPAPWTEGSQANAGAVVLNGGDGRWDWTQNPGANSTLTQAITVPADTSVTTSGPSSTTTVTTHDEITSLAFGLAWQNEDVFGANDNTVTISYAGVTYATFTTAGGGVLNGAGIAGTWAYFNGASGPATTNSVTNEVTGALTTVTITLPAGVTASGNLVFTYGNGPSGAGADDIAIDNVVLTATRTTVTTTTTADTANNDWTATYTENGAAVSIADTDASVFDSDNTNMTAANVVLANPQTGDRLLVGGSAAASGTIGSISWTRTDTNVSFSGAGTAAQYAAAIESVQFENTTDTPSATPRTINVTASDGISTSNTAVATINIDRLPDLVNDAVSGDEDTGISGNVLTNDDVGDTPITSVTVVTGPANGTLTSFNTTTGAFVYTPNAEYNGTDTFTYRVTDADGDISTATVTITINAINDAPVNTLPASYTTNEDASVTLTGLSVADVDVASGSITVTLNVGSGALAATSGGGVTVAGSGTATVTLTGTLANINTFLGGGSAPVFSPAANANGAVTLTMTTNDGGNTGAGGALTDVDTRTITVNPVNDAPTQVVPGSQTTAEDTAQVIAGTSVADVDGGALTTTLTLPVGAGSITVLTGGGAAITNNGTGTVTIAGTAAQINAAIASITYTPTADYNGSTSLSVSTTDGSLTASNAIAITVTAVADIANDAVTTNEDTAATFNVITGAGGATADTFENVGAVVTSVTQGTNGTVTFLANGAVTYTPNANFNGSDSFTYTVTSGGVTETATVTVTVTAVNDAPTQVVPGSQTTAEDTAQVIAGTSVADVDGGALTTTLTLPVGAGSITVLTGGGAAITNNGTGTVTIAGTAAQINAAIASITYTPTADYNGSTSLSVSTTDGSLTASNAIAITVTAVADIANDAVTTNEDTAATFNVITGAGGATADTFENVGAVVTSVTQGTNGTVTFLANGAVTYTPNANFNGSDSFTYTVTSGGVTETATVTVTVTAVNDAPTQVVPGSQTTAEDTAQVIAGTSVADVDGGALTTTLTLPVGAGSITVLTGGGAAITNNGTGTVTIAGTAAQINAAIASITYTPTADYNGSTSLSVSTTDGSLTASNAIAITVTAVADIANDAVTTNEDTAATFNVITGAGGATADTFENVGAVVTSVTQGTNGTVTFLANGAVTYTPNANFNGSDSFTYTVTSGGVTETATVTVTVTAVNDAPTQVVPGSQTTAEDTAQVIAGTSVADVDGGALTTTLTLPVGAGSITVLTGGGAAITNNGTGTVTIAGTAAQINAAIASITYTPTADYNGSTSLSVSTTDGSLTASNAIAITVTAVADIANDAVTTNEDTAATFNVITGAGGATADTFENVGAVVTSVTQGTNGTVTFLANGAVTYTPNANFNGSDSFTYTVTSGGVTETATVTVTVTAVNDAPTQVVPGSQTTAEDTAQVIAGTSVADVDGGALTTTLTLPVGAGSITVLTGGGAAITNNGTGTVTIAGTAAQINAAIASITYTPTADYNGSTSLSVSTTDGSLTASNAIAITVTAVADIANDAVTTNEDTAATFNVITGAGGATADTFENVGAVVTSVTQGTNGTVTFLANGAVTYTPNANFNGSDSFTYTVTSGGVTETATVTVTVTAVNDAPTQVVPGSQTTAEDTAQVIAGTSVADVDGGALTTTLTLPVGAGSITVLTGGGAAITNNGTGTVTIAGTAAQINAAIASITYTPTADYNGSTSLSVSTTDGSLTASNAIAITVTAVADIANDAVTTNEDTAATFNVITGAGGATADTFENVGAVVTSVTQGTNGTVTFLANGAVTYTPNANFNGSDSFTYTVTSGGVTETATVTVTVTAVNDAPTQVVPGSQTTAEDTAQVIAGTSVADVDGGALTTTLTLPVGAGSITVLTGGGAAITNNGTGTVTIAGTAAQINAAIASITYTPTADYNGSTSLSVSTTDGSLTASNAIAITVTAVADIANDAVTTNEDTAATFNVITGAGGATADTFENVGAVVTSVTQGTNGTVTFLANGAVTYTPNANFNGSDSFTYTVTSGGVTETATVTVTVTAVNDAPTQVVPGSQTTAEDTAQVIAGTSVADVDGGALTTTLTLPVGAGSITVLTGGGAAITNNGTGTVTIAGTAAQINAAIASITYTPTADYNGSTSLSVSTTDGSLTASNAIAITVTAVADIANDAVTTNEDTAATFNVITGAGGATADTFENVGAVVTSVTQGTNGTVTFLANGAVTYTPNANFNGSDSFTYTVTSGGVTETATVTVTVTAVNDAPTQVVPGSQTTAEDTAQVIAGTSVADVDGGALTTTLTLPVGAGSITVLTGGGAAITNNGTGTVTIAGTAAQINAAIASITYTPTADYNGSTSLSVSTTDGSLTASNAIAITVTAVADIANDAVTTNEDTAATFNVITGAGGATADTFENVGAVVTSVTQGTNGTVTFLANGAVTYTPNANFNGSDSFTYTVTSGGVTETATVTVTVTAVNDAPVASGTSITTAEDTPFSGMLPVATDVDGDTLTYSLASSAANGVAVVNTDGTYTYTPNAEYYGPDSFTFTVSDGNGGFVTRTVSITVTPVNDAPSAGALANQTSQDADVESYDASTVFSDVDGDTLSYSATGLPAGLSINPSTGVISGTLDQSASQGGVGGVYTVTVTANDGAGGTVSRSFTWTVTNPAPIAGDDAFTTEEDTPLFGNVLGNDSDPDNDALTVNTTPVSGPTHGTLVLNADGTFSYTPDLDYTGSDSFSYQLIDADGGVSTATVSLTIYPENDDPFYSVPGAQSVAEDQPLIFSAANGNAVTVDDGDSASLETTLSVANGTLTLGSTAGVTVTGDGTDTVVITGSPAAITAALNGLAYRGIGDYNGPDLISISTTDGVGLANTSIAITVTPVVDIVADSVTTNEDTAATFNVLTNDTFENAGRAVTSVTQGTNGTVTFLANGSFTYTPNVNFNGSDSFTYTVTSGGVTETTTVTVTVNSVNDAPTQVVPGAQTTAEDTAQVIAGTSVADVDGGALTTTLTLPVGAGSITVLTGGGAAITNNGTGTVTIAGTAAQINAAIASITYTPTADYNGSTSLSVSTTDGSLTASNAIAITVTAVADIVGDSVTTNEDTAATFNVLTNDTFENAGRAVTSVTQGANGTVTFLANGSVTYTPNVNFNGSDSFTYTVTSGGVTETTTVTVTVNSVNDAPTQSVPAAQSTAEDSSLVFRATNGNAIIIADVDGDPLTTTVSVTNGLLNLGSTAGVTVSGNGTNSVTISGSAAAITSALEGLTFSPTADYNGAALLSVSTTDGTATASSNIALSVSPVVDIVADSVTTNEDTAATFNVLTNDTFENAGRAVTSVTQGANGTVTFLANGQITYTPDAEFNGSDSFTYTVTAGGVTETTTVTVTVNSVNDAPTLAAPGPQSTNEDAPVIFSAGNGNAIVVTDVDGGSMTLTLSAANGSLALGSTAGVTVTGNGTGTVTVTGTAAAINAAVNGLSFAPTADYNGSAGLTASVSDGALSASQSVSIAISPVADIVSDSVTTNEDTAVTFNALANDTFENAGRVVSSVTQGASGTVSFLANGAITYTPSVNFNGSDSFSYTVTSGGVTETTTVTVTINAVNDAPTTTGLANRTGTDSQTVNIDVSTAFADVDGDTLTYAISGLPPGLIYNPATGVISGVIDHSASVGGPYTVSVTASDGNPGGNVTTTFTWSISNPAPTATNDAATVAEDSSTVVTVLANDNDPDGDTLTVTTATAGNGVVVINVGGTITYTPAANFNGVDTIVYQISDGEGGVSTATVTVTVTPVNDAPVAVADSFTGAEDTTISGDVTPGTVGQDSDIDGDALAIVDFDGNGANGITPVVGPSNGVLTLNANGTFTYTPFANFNGTDSFTYRITDGNGGFAQATVTLNVTPVNDAPVVAGTSFTTAEDTPYSGALPVATDADGDTLTYSKASNPAHGTVVVNANGTYTYTPVANYNGSDSFTFTVSDGNGGSVTRTVTVVVSPVNDAPVIASIPPPVSNDSAAINLNLGAYVSDVDGTPLTYSATGLPPGLSINPATGRVTGTLPANASSGGPYAVTLTVDDGAGGVVSRTFNWTVNNPAPIALNDAASAKLNETITVAALANDSDPDGDAPISVTSASAANGVVAILPDGSIQYTPAANFAGQDSVTYAISDGNGGSAAATITITVGDDGYTDKETIFGFNGPETKDDGHAPSSYAYESISADGAVIDAVFDINSLNSLATLLSGDGIVVAAANGVASLNGIGAIGANGVVVDTVRLERAREIAFRAGFDRNFHDYRIDGLPGFSLRNNVPGNLGGLSGREQIVIESLVRDRTLIVQISNTLELGARRIVEYKVTQLDGSPLPSWLDRAGPDLLIGRRNVDVDELKLRIVAVYADGSSVVEDVRIDTATGEIQSMKAERQGALTPPAPLLFKDQFRAKPMLSGEEVRGLGRALAR